MSQAFNVPFQRDVWGGLIRKGGALDNNSRRSESALIAFKADREPMMRDQFRSLIGAVVDDNQVRVRQLLKEENLLATRFVAEGQYETKIGHWIHAKDTALHAAAAGQRVEIGKMLLKAGADVNASRNHLRSRPLHYAAGGCVNTPLWDAGRQVAMMKLLLKAGAVIDAQDKNGSTALHRAVRKHCAAAVKCLLDAGADPAIRSKSGRTPFHLAVQSLEHGQADVKRAQESQREIIAAFLEKGVSTSLLDSKRKTVLDRARSLWIRQMLSGSAGRL